MKLVKKILILLAILVLFGQIKTPISADSNNVYAVLTFSGDLVFVKSDNTYWQETEGTVYTYNGNSYSGTIFSIADFPFRRWGNYVERIRRVYVEENTTIAPSGMIEWFKDCTNLSEFCFDGFDTSSVDTTRSMFENCTSLVRVDLSGFNTTNIKDMDNMFLNCSSLQEVVLGGDFLNWINDAYLPSGYWTNGIDIHTEQNLYELYQSNTSTMAGQWKRTSYKWEGFSFDDDKNAFGLYRNLYDDSINSVPAEKTIIDRIPLSNGVEEQVSYELFIDSISSLDGFERHILDTNIFGHVYGEWYFDNESCTHTRTCIYDNSHIQTEPCTFIDDPMKIGHELLYTCSTCGGIYRETINLPTIDGIKRIWGNNRYFTSTSISDELYNLNENTLFDVVVLASGKNFADALSGSYLAAAYNAPLLITSDDYYSTINYQIRIILKPGGRVYVLGGVSAISNNCLQGLEDFNLKRLAGENRYETNLEILKEIGIHGDTILVATGTNYADSLSASATGLPMLLVKDKLDDTQKRFLKANKNKTIYVLGGPNAVNDHIVEQLSRYGETWRCCGTNRFSTSISIARQFYTDLESVVLAYSNDFPDGLCGGPLAFSIGAPLVLTKSDHSSEATEFVRSKGIENGYVLGGEAKLTDQCVNTVFGVYSGGSGSGSGGSSGGSGGSGNESGENTGSYSIVGNINSLIFHRTTCPTVKRMNESNKKYFASRIDALNQGYSPCKVCNP